MLVCQMNALYYSLYTVMSYLKLTFFFFFFFFFSDLCLGVVIKEGRTVLCITNEKLSDKKRHYLLFLFSTNFSLELSGFHRRSVRPRDFRRIVFSYYCWWCLKIFYSRQSSVSATVLLVVRLEMLKKAFGTSGEIL